MQVEIRQVEIIIMKECYIGKETRKLSNQIYRRLSHAISKVNPSLTVSQVWILNDLASHSGKYICQKDMEDWYTVRRSTMSQALSLLEKKGYISRSVSAEDARRKLLTITEKGEAVQKQLMALVREEEKSFVAGVSEEEYACFWRVLDQVQKNVG